MKKKLIYVVLMVLGLGFSGQAQLNGYKYIIVPKKFDAFKSENQYQTSTLVKHYLTENGLTAVYDDALPMDLAGNRCLGLVANLLDESSMFTTKLVLTLKNCQNQEVFRTKEGKSKIKEFEPAHREALEEAFTSFSTIDYQYQGGDTALTPGQTTPQEVPQVVTKAKEQVLEQRNTVEEQIYKGVEPKPSTTVVSRTPRSQNTEDKAPMADLSGTLYAQPIAGGFQLVDSTPKIVLKLEETSMDDIYLAQYGDSNAMVFKKSDQWFLEYTHNGEKKTQELQIKF